MNGAQSGSMSAAIRCTSRVAGNSATMGNASSAMATAASAVNSTARPAAIVTASSP